MSVNWTHHAQVERTYYASVCTLALEKFKATPVLKRKAEEQQQRTYNYYEGDCASKHTQQIKDSDLSMLEIWKT